MSKQLWYVFSSLVLIALLFSACQPKVAVTGTTTTAQSLTASPTALPTTTPTTTPSPSASPTTPPTISLTARPVPTTVPTPGAVWTYETRAPIWGTPAISDGSVYFGSDDGNLYVVDAQTGDLNWKFLTQGFVRSQPAINGGMVFFASDDGYLYALEAQDGTQVWRTDIGNLMPSDGRFLDLSNSSSTGWDYKQSSPVVVDRQVYVGSLDGNVYSLASDTGMINWKFKTGQKVRATPTLADGVLYIGSWDESMYALDALTGQMLWQTPVGGEVQSTALVANGLVYTASRKASVVALDAQTGEKKWEYDYGGNNWVESSPQLVGNVIYIGSSAHMSVYGLDSQTGEELIKYMSYPSQVFLWPTPAIEGIMLYIGGSNYSISGPGLLGIEIPSVITAGSRMKLKWKLPLEDTLMPSNQYWVGVVSSAVVQDGVVYFGALDGKFYAVKATK
jgi:eukaryotic-like serine/threonine-protein kinase